MLPIIQTFKIKNTDRKSMVSTVNCLISEHRHKWHRWELLGATVDGKNVTVQYEVTKRKI